MKKLIALFIILSGLNASAQEDTGSKKNALKIFPNPSQNGSFELRSSEDQPLYFYVFDLSGTLVYQTIVREKGKHTIASLNKGIYVYDVFKNDEGIKHGRLVVK